MGKAGCKSWVQKLHTEANGMESRVPPSREHEDWDGIIINFCSSLLCLRCKKIGYSFHVGARVTHPTGL